MELRVKPRVKNEARVTYTKSVNGITMIEYYMCAAMGILLALGAGIGDFALGTG